MRASLTRGQHPHSEGTVFGRCPQSRSVILDTRFFPERNAMTQRLIMAVSVLSALVIAGVFIWYVAVNYVLQ